MTRQPYSLVIITRDAAALLPTCIASAAGADEVLVVDSGSTDATLDVAQRLGARVIHQEWLGYGPQKQFAVGQARNDWILALDTDERLTPELAAGLVEALAQPACAAYAVARRNRFMGCWLSHGEGYPDWCLRLFDRRRCRWSADSVHERLVVDGCVARLRGDLLHESEQGLSSYLAKQNHYTDLQARLMYARGRRAPLASMLISPLVRFLKFYVLRRGFLDGVPGFVHIAVGCLTAFLKYAKLFELQRQAREQRQRTGE
jgi:glycosyltransferase involved in cell wall biosynthesis